MVHIDKGCAQYKWHSNEWLGVKWHLVKVLSTYYALKSSLPNVTGETLHVYQWDVWSCCVKQYQKIYRFVLNTWRQLFLRKAIFNSKSIWRWLRYHSKISFTTTRIETISSLVLFSDRPVFRNCKEKRKHSSMMHTAACHMYLFWWTPQGVSSGEGVGIRGTISGMGTYPLAGPMPGGVSTYPFPLDPIWT